MCEKNINVTVRSDNFLSKQNTVNEQSILQLQGDLKFKTILCHSVTPIPLTTQQLIADPGEAEAPLTMGHHTGSSGARGTRAGLAR